MRKLTLPCRKEAEIEVKHQGETIDCHANGCTFRGTHVRLTLDGLSYEARSVCKPPDQFSRARGRKIAANRLLTLLRDRKRFPKLELTKADRAVLFCAICPEFGDFKNLKRTMAIRLARKLTRHPEQFDLLMRQLAGMEEDAG